MVNINKTFYDYTCDIYRISVIDKYGTQVPAETKIYTGLKCDYYIASRGNVTNFLPGAEARKTERDRLDCVISGKEYSNSAPTIAGDTIIEGDTVLLYDRIGNIKGKYIIDQLSILSMPNGRIENVYLRLNNDSKGDLH